MGGGVARFLEAAMGEQAALAGGRVTGRSTRRIAVSVVEDDNVVSLVLPDTLVALTLGSDVDEVADALTLGAGADPAFARDGGSIVQSVTLDEQSSEAPPAVEDASVDRSYWLRVAIQALILGTTVAGNPLAATASASAVLLDCLIENEEARLKLLQKIRGLDRRQQDPPTQVVLTSATGDFTYELPMPIDETLSSSEVGEILSPTGKGLRTIAKQRRDANELLAVKIGRNRYRHPKFQLDRRRHEITPVVAYANRAWECSADPWGTLEWWYSPERAFQDRRPVDLVAEGELTTTMVDNAVAFAGLGMD
jgi:hypothetical protein